jgi:astacin (peptidase family M12A)
MRNSSKAALAVLVSALLAGPAISDEGDDLSGGGGPHTAYLRLPDGRFERIPYTTFGGLAIAQSDIILGWHVEVQKQTAYNLAEQLEGLDYEALKQNRPNVHHLKIKPPTEVVSPFAFAVAPNTVGNKPWPDGKIPFVIDPSITDADLQHAIEVAAEEWNKQGIVKIKPVSQFQPAEIAHIQPLIIYSTAMHRCHSHIGYDGRPPLQSGQARNSMHLSNTCKTWRIVHEFGHVLGLQHEHLRNDRNKFMDVINTSLIKPEYLDNYAPPRDGQSFGLGYDPCSIMHYSDKVPKEWTTTGLSENWFTWKAVGQVALDACRNAMQQAQCAEHAPGQRCGFSQTDIETIRQLYQ